MAVHGCNKPMLFRCLLSSLFYLCDRVGMQLSSLHVGNLAGFLEEES
jgi:hypothetical protein